MILRWWSPDSSAAPTSLWVNTDIVDWTFAEAASVEYGAWLTHRRDTSRRARAR